MQDINSIILLNEVIKHETVTLNQLRITMNAGEIQKKKSLDYLLDELSESGFIKRLEGVIPYTYTITDKGIKEGARLKAEMN